MADLPINGGSEDAWGSGLNTFLTIAHEPSGVDGGKLKATALDGRTFTGTVTLPATTSIGTVTNTEIGYVDGVTSSIQTQLNDTSSSLFTHKADNSVHITTGQNTLLDGITVTYTNLNTVDTSSSITTQLGTKATVSDFNNHVADTSAHITTSQNTLLDGITVTYDKINYLSTITSNVQTQLNDTSSSLFTHKADDNVHITTSQNTLLDGITVTYDKINYLSTTTFDVQVQLNDTSSSLYTHISDSSSVHGITGYVVGTTDSQVLTNKTLTYPIINDSSTVVSTSAQINRLDSSLVDTRILYYDEPTNRIVSSSDTSATYVNIGTVVAGSTSNADALHRHTISSIVSSPARSFNIAYQPDTSTSTFVALSTSHTITTGGGSAYIEVKSDSAATPTTVIATSGIQTGLINDAATFTTSFIVRKNDYYQVNDTSTNGTVTAVNWVETLINTGN